MSIGIKQTDSTLVATPDKAMTKNSTPKILTATFGDGYETKAKSYEDMGIKLFKPVKMTFNVEVH